MSRIPLDFDTIVKAVEVVTLLLLVYGLIAYATGMILRERRRGYRLPYEQPTHVRKVREDRR